MDKLEVYYYPLIEGTDGSTPETALAIHVVRKENLVSEQLKWFEQRYWAPMSPPIPRDDFRQGVTHETKRIKRRVYDIVMLKLPGRETRRIYFDVSRQRVDWPRQ